MRTHHGLARRWLPLLLLVLTTWVHASRAAAESPAVSTTSLSEADERLKKEVSETLKNPPSGDKEQVCKTLNGVNARIVNRAVIPPGLKASHESLQLLRCSLGCCTRCPPGQICPKAKCSTLLERFSQELRRYEACHGNCSESQSLSDEIGITFVDLVKECPRGDANITWARSRLTLIVAPADIVARLLELSSRRQLDAKSAKELLEKLLALDDDVLRASALKELTRIVESLAQRGETVAPAQVRELLTAASALFALHLPKEALQDAIRVLTDLTSAAQIRRMVDMLELARDLEDPSTLKDLDAAIALLRDRDPELKSKLESLPPLSPAERVRAVVSLLNDAQLLELKKLRADAGFWRAVQSVRRMRLKVVTKRDGCSDSNSAACLASEAFRNEFVKTLKVYWPQGVDEVAFEGDPRSLLDEVEQVFDPKAERCAWLKDNNRSAHAALCDGPYLGVVWLSIGSPADAPERLDFKAFWVTRTVNAVIEKCKTDTCPAGTVQADLHSATAAGAALASRVVKANAVAAAARNFAVEVARPLPQPRSFARAWQKVGRPVALLGAFGLVTSGVYVSNTQPDSSSGDWLWRAGLGVFVIEIGAETWLYFAD